MAMGRDQRLEVAAIVLFVAVALVAAALYLGHGRYTADGLLPRQATVVIPKGTGVAGIAHLLQTRRVISDRRLFMAGVRVFGLDRRLRAGEFAFPAGISMAAVARLLASGRTVKRKLTLAEGLTTSQVLAQIDAAEGFSGALPVGQVSEGALLPETYFYSHGDPRSGLVRRMREAMTRMVKKLWRTRAADTILRTPLEALTLASIIEKETSLAGERFRISAVFHNRLRRSMRLQSDPTVVYGLTAGKGILDRPLTRRDLAHASPYNTYRNGGLPPGPIANPGRAALEAALHPAETGAYYFVADGTGGHAFAATLDEHDLNVQRYRDMLSGGVP